MNGVANLDVMGARQHHKIAGINLGTIRTTAILAERKIANCSPDYRVGIVIDTWSVIHIMDGTIFVHFHDIACKIGRTCIYKYFCQLDII